MQTWELGTGQHALLTPACSLGGCEAYRFRARHPAPQSLTLLASGVWAFLPTEGAALTLRSWETCLLILSLQPGNLCVLHHPTGVKSPLFVPPAPHWFSAVGRGEEEEPGDIPWSPD